MAKIVLELKRTVVIETENVNDLDTLGVLSWFGMSGQTQLTLKRGDDPIVPGYDLGESWSPAPVVEVKDTATMHIADGAIPAGRDWRRYPYNGLGG